MSIVDLWLKKCFDDMDINSDESERGRMNAEEMLRGLGYELTIENEHGILFDKEGGRIYFDKDKKRVAKSEYDIDRGWLIGYFDSHELKAIQQMFYERGWLE